MSPILYFLLEVGIALLVIAVWFALIFVVYKLVERPVDTFLNWLFSKTKAGKRHLAELEESERMVAEFKKRYEIEEQAHQDRINAMYREAGVSREGPSHSSSGPESDK